jgi:two-component system, chemotaxis family, protein-glutamate methylesterase/glutaminase
VQEERKGLNVLVVDDSAVVRQALSSILSGEPDIQVQSAPDPIIAEQKMARFAPDVIVLDLEMPRMDGLTFLRKLMRERPLPVVVCSSYAEDGSDMALRALELGAVDILPKPRLGVREFLHDSAVMLLESVRGAAMARVPGQHQPMRRSFGEERRAAEGAGAGVGSGIPARQNADVVLPPGIAPRVGVEVEPVIAMGASTGGTEALRALLDALPADAPPILIVQHMPVGFTKAFANRLARSARMVVREAADGDRVVRGQALIARGDRHLLLHRQATRCYVEVREGPLVSRHRPSVDVLFRSVAQAMGPRAVGLIMTGMGDDGAEGLLEMREAGAMTLAQDEASSVVFGMPREAIVRGAVSAVLALSDLPMALVRAAAGQASAPNRSQLGSGS